MRGASKLLRNCEICMLYLAISLSISKLHWSWLRFLKIFFFMETFCHIFGLSFIKTYLAISRSISCSNCTNIGANMPSFAPRLATSRSVSITCFSFFLQTKSSVSNIMHSITPENKFKLTCSYV